MRFPWKLLHPPIVEYKERAWLRTKNILFMETRGSRYGHRLRSATLRIPGPP